MRLRAAGSGGRRPGREEAALLPPPAPFASAIHTRPAGGLRPLPCSAAEPQAGAGAGSLQAPSPLQQSPGVCSSGPGAAAARQVRAAARPDRHQPPLRACIHVIHAAQRHDPVLPAESPPVRLSGSCRGVRTSAGLPAPLAALKRWGKRLALQQEGGLKVCSPLPSLA